VNKKAILLLDLLVLSFHLRVEMPTQMGGLVSLPSTPQLMSAVSP
jgi:hypothetical protein